jgi:hypothetical protein
MLECLAKIVLVKLRLSKGIKGIVLLCVDGSLALDFG